METSTYKRGEDLFQRYGIVIWTGRPGCGKTLDAIHLIIKEQRREDINWTFRKIRSFGELSYVEQDENTLIFIDNVFFSQSTELDLKEWWIALNNVYDNYFQQRERCENLHRVGVVITARENAVERACSLMEKMNVTPLLRENVRIDVNVLTEQEKEDILVGQIKFAKEEMKSIIPKIDETFREKIKETDGPIGFPLCAHLFLCSEEYQKSGANFFTRPIEYLKRQIHVEIGRDKCNKTKSLFFVLFFHEWQTKLGNVKKIQLQSNYQCRAFLDEISTELLKNFEPFNFNGLVNEAQRLVGAFLKVESENSYKFVHDSVYEAVGAWFCESYIAQTAKYFPLEIIQNQEYENATENKEAQSILANRLLYEILDQRLSKVFACKCFQHQSFCKCFFSELAKKSTGTVVDFLTITNESSPVKLPCLFWTSLNHLTYLTENIYNMIQEKFALLDSNYHLYVSLYGECCARKEGLLMFVNGMLRDNIKEIKKRVLDFYDDKGNTILHLVITSERTDTFASEVVKKLLEEEHENVAVDVRNKKNNKTPLMLAVCQPERLNVIKVLIGKHPKLLLRDVGQLNVLHHCLGSSNDDATCAEYLDIILRGRDAENCLTRNDSKGNTPLAIAAMESKYSRVLSILNILNVGSTQIIRIINDAGLTPLHLSIRSLKGKRSTLAELECCVRVILLLLYGGSPDNRSDKDDEVMTECENENLKNILRKPNDEYSMLYALDSFMEKIKDGKDINDPKPALSKSIGPNFQTRIQKAIQILKNCRLDITE